MPFFHVIVRIGGSDAKERGLFLDLSERELEAKFTKPYSRAESILSGNDVIDSKRIASVRIIRTDQTNEAERNKLNDDHLRSIDNFNRNSDNLVILSPGFGYDDKDIAEAGKDVTTEYLKGPPGYLHQELSFIRNTFEKFFLPVFVGVIVAALIVWLNLK